MSREDKSTTNQSSDWDGCFCFTLLFCNLALQTPVTLFLLSLAEGISLLSESVTWSCQTGWAVPAPWNLCSLESLLADSYRCWPFPGCCILPDGDPADTCCCCKLLPHHWQVATTAWSWQVRTSFGRWHYFFFYLVPLGRVKNKE